MAYDNIRFIKPNMEFVGGYFYTMDDTYDVLLQKVDDGSTVFTYPLQGLLSSTVNSLHYDGANFWTMQDSGNGFAIKRWRIENNIVELKDAFTYTDTAFINYDADTFSVENYITEFSSTISGGNTTIIPQEYYDSVITSGTILTLGPNRFDEREEVTVSGVSGSDVTLVSGIQYSYESGDPISMYRSFFVFNNYDGLDGSNGSLMRFNAYTGNLIVSDVRSEYKDITSCTFARVTNLLRDHDDVHTVIFVKGTQARFRNMSDLTDLLQADSVNEYFTEPDGTPPNSTRWLVTYGNPLCYDNELFCSTTIDGRDEILTNYEILDDFSVQISGSVRSGFISINPDSSYFRHYMSLYSDSNEYGIGITCISHYDVDISGMVREYTMDSVSGTVLYDTSSVGSNATLSNIDIVPGRIGNAAEINSKTDYITLNSVVNTSNISVSMLYYFNDTMGNWNTLLCRAGGTNHHMLIQDSDKEIGFYNGAWYSSGYALTPGNWYHLVLVKSGSNSKLYINNTLVQNSNSSFSNASFPLAIIGNFMVGGDQGAIGKIDNVRIFNKVLSIAEINELYNESIYNDNLDKLLLYTNNNGVIGNMTVISGVDYFFKLSRSDDILSCYYKNVVSGVIDQSWNYVDNFTTTDRNCNISLGLLSAGLTVSGAYFDNMEYDYGTVRYPPPTTPYYDIMNIDNIRTNQSTIIPVTDISYSTGNLYRLQDEGTYYGTDNDWGSQYNYVCSPVRSFIDAITIEAYPVILPANGRNMAEVNCVVLDQYSNGAINRPIFFTDNDDYGYITINPKYTDYIHGTGEAITYYRSGVDVHTVTIQGTVTQYD